MAIRNTSGAGAPGSSTCLGAGCSRRAKADYKHCLYAHLKYCTAPCVGNVTRDQYLEQVKAACDFLEGQCRDMQAHLEEEMKKAAAAHEFEQAAELRDLLRDLQESVKKTGKFVRVPYTLPVSINPTADLVELAKVLGLPEPPQRIEGFDISNISGTFAVASLVAFKNGRPDRGELPAVQRSRQWWVRDDFASMAEVVRRRYSRLKRELEAGPVETGEDGGLKVEDRAKQPLPLPDLILSRWRQRATGHGGGGIEEAGIGTHFGHRAGEGV